MIKPILTDDDHAAAVREIAALWNAAEDSVDDARLDALATLVDAYERNRWPSEPLDPVEAIKAHMDLSGRTRSDLANVLGSQPRASEILRRVRPLTLEMIRSLEAAWRIPSGLLTARYDLRRVPKGTGQRPAAKSKRRDAA